MSFFNINRSVEAVKESDGSGFISKSGFYDVVIKYAWVTRNDSNARSINLLFEYNGTTQYLYNAFRLDNNDGTPNFGADKFNKLCIILDIDSVEATTMPIPVGKQKAMEEKEVLTEFEDKEVTLLLRNVYNKSNKTDKIYKGLSIYNLYRTSDKATAPEIVNSSPTMGAKFIKDSDKEITDVYRNMTKEEADTFDKEEREKFSANKEETDASSTESSNKSLFD